MKTLKQDIRTLCIYTIFRVILRFVKHIPKCLRWWSWHIVEHVGSATIWKIVHNVHWWNIAAKTVSVKIGNFTKNYVVYTKSNWNCLHYFVNYNSGGEKSHRKNKWSEKKYHGLNDWICVLKQRCLHEEYRNQKSRLTYLLHFLTACGPLLWHMLIFRLWHANFASHVSGSLVPWFSTHSVHMRCVIFVLAPFSGLD